MNFFKSFYLGLITVGKWLQSPLLLLVRLFWGYIFFTTGLGKLQNISGVAAYFDSLGVPFSVANAYLVGCVEFFGGICLIIGFAVRLMAIPMIGTMVVALLTAAHDATLAIFSDSEGFIVQLPVTFLLVLLFLFAFGPGIFSIDYLLQTLFFKNDRTKGDCCYL